MLETVLIIIALVLMVLGIIGCVVPGLPGPGFSFIALVLFQFAPAEYPFSWWTLGLFLPITIGLIVLDYVGPAYATKKFGGTQYGVWGGIIGLFVGMIFFPPFGIILGPLVGAVVGDLIAGKRIQHALKSGLGSFIGFVAVTSIKLLASTIMSFILMWELIAIYGSVLNPLNWFS